MVNRFDQILKDALDAYEDLQKQVGACRDEIATLKVRNSVLTHQLEKMQAEIKQKDDQIIRLLMTLGALDDEQYNAIQNAANKNNYIETTETENVQLRKKQKSAQKSNVAPLGDILVQDLRLLFCSINSGKTAAEEGHFFAHRGNDFWKLFNEAALVQDVLDLNGAHDIECAKKYKIGFASLINNRIVDDFSKIPNEEGVQGLFRILKYVVPVTRTKTLCFVGYKILDKWFDEALALLCEDVAFEWNYSNENKDGFRGCLNYFNGLTTKVYVLADTSGSNRAISRETKLKVFKQLAAVLKSDNK